MDQIDYSSTDFLFDNYTCHFADIEPLCRREREIIVFYLFVVLEFAEFFSWFFFFHAILKNRFCLVVHVILSSYEKVIKVKNMFWLFQLLCRYILQKTNDVETDKPVSQWRSRLTLSVMTDKISLDLSTLTSDIGQHIMLVELGW